MCVCVCVCCVCVCALDINAHAHTHTHIHTWKFQCCLGLVVPISNEVLTMYVYKAEVKPQDGEEEEGEEMRNKKLTEMNMQMTRKECRSIRFAIGPYREGG